MTTIEDIIKELDARPDHIKRAEHKRIEIGTYISDTAYWQGKTPEKIARDLKVSVQTVESWLMGLSLDFNSISRIEDYLKIRILNIDIDGK